MTSLTSCRLSREQPSTDGNGIIMRDVLATLDLPRRSRSRRLNCWPASAWRPAQTSCGGPVIAPPVLSWGWRRLSYQDEQSSSIHWILLTGRNQWLRLLINKKGARSALFYLERFSITHLLSHIKFRHAAGPPDFITITRSSGAKYSPS